MNKEGNTHTGIGRKAVSAVLAGLLGVSMISMPTVALAEQTTTRSYTWKDGEQQPTAAQTVTANGVTYTLSSTSAPVKSGSDKTLTQSFTTTVTGTSSDVNGVVSAVPTSTQYSEDGYSGTLYRTSVSYTPIYVTQTKTETRTMPGTFIGGDSQPADSNVPTPIVQNGHTFDRTSVSWQKVDKNGDSTKWSYVATYSRTYQDSVLDHYDVVGTYSGNLTKTVSGGTWSMTATYTAPDQQQDAEDTGETQTLGDDQNANQDDANADNTDNVSDAENADANADSAGAGYELDSSTNGNGASNDAGESATNGSDASDGTTGILGAVREHPWLLLIPVILIIAIIAAIVAALKRRKKAPVAAAPLAVPADIYGINAELIEFVNDGTDENQHIRATCDAYMSPDTDTPTLVEIPQPPMRFEPAATVDENGEPVLDEEDNQVYDDYYVIIGDTSYDAVASGTTDDSGYATLESIPDGKYVAITDGGQPQPLTVGNGTAPEVELVSDGSESDLDYESITRDNVGLVPGDATVRVLVRDADGNPLGGVTVDLLTTDLLADAKSQRLVIESNGHAIYDGQLATQVKIDSKLLTDALNGESTDNDITEDVDKWLDTYDAYDEHRNEIIAQARDAYDAKAQAAGDEPGQPEDEPEDDADDTSSIPTVPADADDSIDGFGDVGEPDADATDDDYDTQDTSVINGNASDNDTDGDVDLFANDEPGFDDDDDDDLDFDDIDEDDTDGANG